jgi:hypothetical protein
VPLDMAKIQNPVIALLSEAAITDDAWGFQLQKPEQQEQRLHEILSTAAATGR